MEVNTNGPSEDPQQKEIISKYSKLFTPNQSILTSKLYL